MSELPPELRRIVEDGYLELAPSATDRERIRRRVLLATSTVAASAPLQAAAASTTAAGSSSVAASSGAVGGLSAVKVLLGTLAVGGIIAGGVATLRWMSHEQASSSITLDEGASLTLERAVAPGSSLQLSSAVERVELPVSEENQVALDSERPRARPPRSAVSQAMHADAKTDSDTTPRPARSEATTELSMPRAVEPTDGDESRPGDTLVGELALLDKARAANASCDSAQALALLGRYEREHATGQLAPEAAYLRIVVLCRAGRQELAQAHANAFSQHWPTSTLRSRVARVCELPEAQEICDDND